MSNDPGIAMVGGGCAMCGAPVDWETERKEAVREVRRLVQWKADTEVELTRLRQLEKEIAGQTEMGGMNG